MKSEDEVTYGPDDNDAIFEWTIKYGDGKEEPFTGMADEVFEYALSKSKVFTVEKAKK